MTFAWVMLEEKKGKRILYGRNRKDRRVPELPDVRMEGVCERTSNVYNFLGCY